MGLSRPYRCCAAFICGNNMESSSAQACAHTSIGISHGCTSSSACSASHASSQHPVSDLGEAKIDRVIEVLECGHLGHTYLTMHPAQLWDQSRRCAACASPEQVHVYARAQVPCPSAHQVVTMSSLQPMERTADAAGGRRPRQRWRGQTRR
jgi:hypothetical protein